MLRYGNYFTLSVALSLSTLSLSLSLSLSLLSLLISLSLPVPFLPVVRYNVQVVVKGYDQYSTTTASSSTRDDDAAKTKPKARGFSSLHHLSRKASRGEGKSERRYHKNLADWNYKRDRGIRNSRFRLQLYPVVCIPTTARRRPSRQKMPNI